MVKTELNTELALPDVTNSHDDCIGRLNGMLESRIGIEKAHIREHDGETNKKICVHFDPNKISIGEIRQFAIQVGTELGH